MRTARFLTAGCVAGAVLFSGAAPSLADAAPAAQRSGHSAHSSKTCHQGPSSCVLKKKHPRSGTVVVKVNVHGTKKNGPLYGWDVRKGNKILCTGEVREHWKTRTKKCTKMPKGKLTLNVPHRKGATIAMSW